MSRQTAFQSTVAFSLELYPPYSVGLDVYVEQIVENKAQELFGRFIANNVPPMAEAHFQAIYTFRKIAAATARHPCCLIALVIISSLPSLIPYLQFFEKPSVTPLFDSEAVDID